MTKRSVTGKRPKNKHKQSKPGLSRLAMIIFAVIIAIAFIVFGIYTPGSKKPPASRQASTSAKKPEFRKDGVVKIISNGMEHIVDVEVADDEEERMQGLMYRHSMEEHQGMLFIFPEEELRSFWMKNTFISLDIIYINSNKEIISIQKYTQPKSTYSQPSEKPARYVLEVIAGFADKYNVKAGDKIEF